MEASEKLFQFPGRSRSPHGGRRRIRLLQGGRDQAQALPGRSSDPDVSVPEEMLLDPQAVWAARREAELRNQRQPEWQHNEDALGEFDPATLEERIARANHETLLRSFEQVPGLRALYSFDQESETELLDPEKCQAAGESAVHGILQKLISARLEGSPDRDMACSGPKAGIRLHISDEQLPGRRLCLAYAEPEYSRRDGVDMVSKRALVYEPDSERFVCQEISRPWADVGSNRNKVADGVVMDDVSRTESPRDLLDIVSAISFLAEAKALKPKPGA